MPNQNNINNASEQIATLVDKARTELVVALYNIGEGVKDINSFIEALLAMDIDGTLKSKLQKATTIYANAHRNVLQSTTMFGRPDGNLLVSFAKLNEELFDSAIIRTISGHIKTQVSQGLIAGLTSKQITEGLIDSSISVRQMETVVNTTLNTYSRMATNQMMDTAPDNTLYNYIGPADGRTRDFCLQQISAGRLTEAEIVSNFGVSVLKDGGGFNCRHKWDFAPVEQSAFHETKEAGLVIEERKANA